MATTCTRALVAQLTAQGEDPLNFADEFDRWKSRGQAGEYDSYLFGKDGAYARPNVNGRSNVLRHVHLVPLADPVALKAWNAHYKRRQRKVSNRALVYASDATRGHLLIYILAEPDAHAIARMHTALHRQLMLKLAAVADRFTFDGTNIG